MNKMYDIVVDIEEIYDNFITNTSDQIIFVVGLVNNRDKSNSITRNSDHFGYNRSKPVNTSNTPLMSQHDRLSNIM